MCETKKFRLKLVLYLAVLAANIIHGLVVVFNVRDDIVPIAKHKFDEGYSFLNRPRDSSWSILKLFTHEICRLWYWYLLHIIVTATSRIFLPPARQSACHALVSLLALTCSMPSVHMAALCCMLGMFLLALCYNSSKLIIWTLVILWLLFLHLLQNQGSKAYKDMYHLCITLCWVQLRCCSFLLTRKNHLATAVRGDVEQLYTLEHFLGYVLYFPCLTFGPLIVYKRYIAMLGTRERQATDLLPKCRTLLWTLLRLLCCFFMLQLVYHYIYIGLLARSNAAMKLITSVHSSFALVYLINLNFYLYYAIAYGFGIAFATFDGIDAPIKPRFTYYKAQHIWKHFDAGLYDFLFQHIYAEICKPHSFWLRKVFATACTFAFVFAWHGMYRYVLIWSASNFAILIMERFLETFSTSAFYNKWISYCLGAAGPKRLQLFFKTQIYLLTFIVNAGFIGVKFTTIFLYNIYASTWSNYLATTFIVHCICQWCEAISNRNTMLKSANKKDK